MENKIDKDGITYVRIRDLLLGETVHKTIVVYDDIDVYINVDINRNGDVLGVEIVKN